MPWKGTGKGGEAEACCKRSVENQLKNAIAAIAALSFIILIFSLSPDSWQKPGPPAPSSPAGKTHTQAGYSHQPVQSYSPGKRGLVWAHKQTHWLCNPWGWASCRGTLRRWAAPSHHFTSKPVRAGKKTTEKSKIWASCVHHVQTRYTELPGTESKAI